MIQAQRAIEIINNYDVYSCGYCHQGTKEIEEAFNIAVKAIQTLEQIKQIINAPVYIQEDVLRYKMIYEVMKEDPYQTDMDEVWERANCNTCRNNDTYHCAECENKSDYEQAQADEDAISRQAVLDLVNSDWKYEGLETDVASLPPVNPQPKTGHWIEHPEIKTSTPEYLMFYECSECGDKQCFCKSDIQKKHFCNNCGARMFEPQESEDKG